MEKTREIARNLAEKVLKKKQKKAVVIGLEGELGSGKTTFSQFFAKALGIKENVLSPTFILVKKYKLKNRDFIHIDAYRIENPKELLSLAWQDLISNPRNIVLIEWTDRIRQILPKDYIQIKFKIVNENKREIIANF